jgi:hypothetical protein
MVYNGNRETRYKQDLLNGSKPAYMENSGGMAKI